MDCIVDLLFKIFVGDLFAGDLVKINGIPLRDGSDLEDLNKCLWLVTGDANYFMCKISEMTLWPNLKYHEFKRNVINREKRVANMKSLKALF